MNPRSRMVIFVIPILSLGWIVSHAYADEKPSDLIASGKKSNPCQGHGELYSPSQGKCYYTSTMGKNKGRTTSRYLYKQFGVKTDCDSVADKSKRQCKFEVEALCKNATTQEAAASCVEKAKADVSAKLPKAPVQPATNPQGSVGGGRVGAGSGPATDSGGAPSQNPTANPANQEGKADESGPAAEKDQKEFNPVTVITQKLLKDPEKVGESIGKSIAYYVVNGSGGRFVSKDLNKDRLKPSGWVKAKVKGNKAPDVAQLYFLMGSGDQDPFWLVDRPDVAKVLKGELSMRTAFYKGMERWTKTPADAGVSQCCKPSDEDWLRRFLEDAAQVSAKILKDPTFMKELEAVTKLSERSDKSTGTKTGGEGKTAIKSSAKSFDYDSMYKRGGVGPMLIYRDGDKVSRAITMKMYTVKENGALVNKVALIDVTNPSDTFFQTFTIPSNGGQSTFALDDRTPGMPKYSLEFTASTGGDTLISFGRTGNASQMQTSLNALYTARARQAVEDGNITKVGDKPYYVLGQGAVNGSLLFFPVDQTNQALSGKALLGPDKGTPELAAEVCQRSPNGASVNMSYTKGRDLGTAANGKQYHLEFDKDHGYWEVKEGPGDPDTPPATAGKDSGGKDSSGPTPPNTSFEDGLQKGGMEPDKAVFNGLDAPYQYPAKDAPRLWKCVKCEKGPDNKPPTIQYRHPIIVPAALYAKRNMYLPFPVEKGDDDPPMAAAADGEVRGIHHYLAYTYGTKTTYYDLAKSKKVEEGADGNLSGLPYDAPGSVKDGVISVPEDMLLDDALAQANFPLKGGKTVNDVKAQLNDARGDSKEAYTITGTAESGILSVSLGTRGSVQFWPTAGKFTSTEGHADTKGPGHAFDFGGLGLDQGESMQETLGIDADPEGAGNPKETVSRIVMGEGQSSALYCNGEQDPAQKRCYFVYKMTSGADGTVRRSKAGFAFSGDGKKPALPVDLSKVQIQGVWLPPPATQPPSSGQFRYKGDAGKGLYYAVSDSRYSQESKTWDKKYCLGPVIWWGMEKTAAEKACQKDKL